jgi:ABC-type sulfate transport system permease component
MSAMAKTILPFSLALQLLCAAALMLVVWGLAAVLLLGFAANPAGFWRAVLTTQWGDGDASG